MQLVAAARHAMHTRFEIVAYGDNQPALRAAVESALDEVEHLEQQISRFRPDSEIALVNREASRHPVRVSPTVFELLERAQLLWQESGGAFDPTILPLLECWQKASSEGSVPSDAQIEQASKLVGMDKVELRKANRTVRFALAGMALDLGAIGKGYAIDCAVSVLQENGAASAFIHGGTSSAHGLGNPPGRNGWKLGIENPVRHVARPELYTTSEVLTSGGQRTARPTRAAAGRGLRCAPRGRRSLMTPCVDKPFIAEVVLHDLSLGVSAVRHPELECGDRAATHVVDPLSGSPRPGALLAAVVAQSATEADAFATALLAGGRECLERLAARKSGCSFLLVCETPHNEPLRLIHCGFAFSGQTEDQK